jgi:hypothetical protein
MTDAPSAPTFVFAEEEEDDDSQLMWKKDTKDYKMDVITLHELQSDEKRQNRTAKDIPCFLLFYVVVMLLFYTIALSYTYGKPSALPIPEESYVTGEIKDVAALEVGILQHDARYIFAALVGAILLTVGWFELVKRISFYIVYGMAAISVLLLVLLGAYLFQVSHYNGSTELLIVALICWLVAVILCLLGYVLKDKVSFTIEVMGEAGKLLAKVPEIYGVGLVAMILYLVMAGVWISSMVYLFSVPNSADLLYDSEDSMMILNYIFDGSYRHLFWILLLGGLWVLSVFGFVEQYIVASVVYQHLELTTGTRKRATNVLARATFEALTYSFGSLAFGSLLTAAAWFLGMIAKLEFLKNRIPLKEYAVTKFIIDVFSFILDWVSDFAVIYVAITGKSFLQSSKTVVGLLRSEFSQAVVTGLIINYVLLIGKILCTVLVTGITLWIINLRHAHIGIVSVLVLITATYYLLHLMSKIYSIACDTVLVYVINDITTNKDSKQFKSPERLRNVLLLNKLSI